VECKVAGMLTVDRSRDGDRAGGTSVDVAQGERELLETIGTEWNEHHDVKTPEKMTYPKLFSS
jgi:hypothetical protein